MLQRGCLNLHPPLYNLWCQVPLISSPCTPKQYVALSRCRRLCQLHLWGLEREAITAEPHVAREYRRLAQRPLTAHRVQHVAPHRATPVLPHLAAVPAIFTDE